MKESVFQSKIIRLCKDQGAWIFNVWGNVMQRSGIPDLYIAHPKFRGWIELKVGAGKPSGSQIANIHALQECGSVAFVVTYKKNRLIYYDFLDGVNVYCDCQEDFFADPMNCLQEVVDLWCKETGGLSTKSKYKSS